MKRASQTVGDWAVALAILVAFGAMLAIPILDGTPAYYFEVVGAFVGTLLLVGISLHVNARLSSPAHARLSATERREKWCSVSYWLLFIWGPTIVALFVMQSAFAFVIFAVLALGLPKVRFLHRFWERLWNVSTTGTD